MSTLSPEAEPYGELVLISRGWAPVRLWRMLVMDLRNGRNFDLYVTSLIALMVGVLGAFEVVNASVLAAATLATLGLVAVGSLGGRHQIASLTSTITELATLVTQGLAETPSADRLFSASTSGLDVELRRAKDIRIVGVTLCRTIRNHMLTLQRRLEQGAVVRIAVIEPGSGALLEAARRSSIPDSPQIFENRLRPTIDLLRQLVDAPKVTGRIEIRLLRFVPAFGLILVDPEDLDGRIHVEVYSHRFAGREPTLALVGDRDPRWYRHFLQEFDQIWATGRDLSECIDVIAPATPSCLST
jgi:hypothetical protein